MQYNSYLTMKYLTEHMLVRASRSLDLLLGIIVFVGWYHKHCLMHAQLNNAVHLAFSLVADLGLNRNPQLAERTRLLNSHPVEPQSRTLEERRCMLGVWYLSSILNVAFSRLESLTYSRYVEDCLQALESAREYESDGVLVTLIRVQRLTAEIHLLHTGESNELNPAPSLLPKASHAAYVAAFQMELDRIRGSLPRSLRSNKTIESSLVAAQLHLYEPPLLTAKLLQKLSAPVSVSGVVQGGGLGSLDVLYHANAALKRWFDTFLGMPVSGCLTLPLSLSAQLIYAITMLSRWAKLTAPWLAGRTGPDAESGAAGAGQNSKGETLNLSDVNFSAAQVQGIPPTIAALNAHLASTPGLALDVTAVLGAMANRFEAVIADLDQSSPNQTSMVDGGAEGCSGPGAPITSIWELGVRKIRITRAKLERITQMAAAGIGNIGEVGCDAAVTKAGGPDAHLCACSIEAGEDGSTASPAKQCREYQGRGCSGGHCELQGPPPHSHDSHITPQGRTSVLAAPPGPGMAPAPPPFGSLMGMGLPVSLGGSGLGSVIEMAQGVDWLKNSYWANSNDVFDGLDPNLWWDGSGSPSWGCTMDTDPPEDVV
ncbi:hypothetical protein MKZ38_000041 [Zalerion maritima]|uniref:Uncharacterized protein n=1 Tax=Zalerion maritima TaxID=339359 RepID=A0AAD5RTN1_9PEZI|nr:hypothetical protein MKZ38_000041 [Zalerion maritima]